MIAAPFNRKAIENALCAWFEGATSIPALWLSQDAPAVALPYGTLNVLSVSNIGSADDEQRISEEPTEVLITHASHKRLVVSINTYARINDPDADARAFMDRARGALALAEFVEPLRAAGVAIVSIGQTQSLDHLQNGGFVSRAQFDLTISIASNLEERFPYIATIDVVADAALGAPFILDATE